MHSTVFLIHCFLLTLCYHISYANLRCNCTISTSKFCSSDTGTCDAEESARKLKKSLSNLYTMVRVLSDFSKQRPRKESKDLFCSRMTEISDPTDLVMLDFQVSDRIMGRLKFWRKMKEFQNWQPACVNFMKNYQRVYSCSLAPPIKDIGIITAEAMKQKLKRILQFVGCSKITKTTEQMAEDLLYCRNKDYCISSGSEDISYSAGSINEYITTMTSDLDGGNQSGVTQLAGNREDDQAGTSEATKNIMGVLTDGSESTTTVSPGSVSGEEKLTGYDSTSFMTTTVITSSSAKTTVIPSGVEETTVSNDETFTQNAAASSGALFAAHTATTTANSTANTSSGDTSSSGQSDEDSSTKSSQEYFTVESSNTQPSTTATTAQLDGTANSTESSQESSSFESSSNTQSSAATATAQLDGTANLTESSQEYSGVESSLNKESLATTTTVQLDGTANSTESSQEYFGVESSLNTQSSATTTARVDGTADSSTQTLSGQTTYPDTTQSGTQAFSFETQESNTGSENSATSTTLSNSWTHYSNGSSDAQTTAQSSFDGSEDSQSSTITSSDIASSDADIENGDTSENEVTEAKSSGTQSEINIEEDKSSDDDNLSDSSAQVLVAASLEGQPKNSTNETLKTGNLLFFALPLIILLIDIIVCAIYCV